MPNYENDVVSLACTKKVYSLHVTWAAMCRRKRRN